MRAAFYFLAYVYRIMITKIDYIPKFNFLFNPQGFSDVAHRVDAGDRDRHIRDHNHPRHDRLHDVAGHLLLPHHPHRHHTQQ